MRVRSRYMETSYEDHSSDPNQGPTHPPSHLHEPNIAGSSHQSGPPLYRSAALTKGRMHQTVDRQLTGHRLPTESLAPVASKSRLGRLTEARNDAHSPASDLYRMAQQPQKRFQSPKRRAEGNLMPQQESYFSHRGDWIRVCSCGFHVVRDLQYRERAVFCFY